MTPEPSPAPRRRPRRRPRRQLAQQSTFPWLWLGGCFALYAAAGVILAAFPAPYWIWYLALGGTLMQAIVLAGPRALAQVHWLPANLLAILAILATGATGAALAISLNQAGTDNLDDIVPQATVLEVALFCAVALLIAAAAAILSAETGDRLLLRFRRYQTSLILAAFCVLGLGLGGLMGVGIASGG